MNLQYDTTHKKLGLELRMKKNNLLTSHVQNFYGQIHFKIGIALRSLVPFLQIQPRKINCTNITSSVIRSVIFVAS